jgi:SAM-dependent methyltransferase
MQPQQFNFGRHSAQERLDPGPAHSRRMHLRLLRREVERAIKRHVSPLTSPVLYDVGCGNMPYRPLFQPHVAKYVGIDLPGNPLADVFVDPSTNHSPLADASCDVALSIQVLEHVAEPDRYLAECHRLLKPGATLILSTHGHWMFHPDPIDYWRWTSQGLRITLERAGFEVVEMHGVMNLLSTAIQLFQDAALVNFPMTRLWSKPFQFVSQGLIWLTETYVGLSTTATAYVEKDASVFFVVARKSRTQASAPAVDGHGDD